MVLEELLKSALFGLVEGISEWLPISSTGHLLILEEFFPLAASPSFMKIFLVVIQLGAILAVLCTFFKQLNPFSSTKSPDEKRATWTLWAKTLVACIPAAVLGIPLDDLIDEKLGSIQVIAGTLLVYGVIFIVMELLRAARARRLATAFQGKHFERPHESSDNPAVLVDQYARIDSLEKLDWKTTLGIGCFQVLSLVPGTSRSGSTIFGGLLLGCSRKVIAEFSFFLAIPVMCGASLLRVVKFFLQHQVPTLIELGILGTGCAVAFVVSLLVIRYFLQYIRKHSFILFGIYRIGLALMLIYLLMNNMLGTV